MKNCIDIFLKCDIDLEQKKIMGEAHKELKKIIDNNRDNEYFTKEYIMEIVIVVYERKILSYDAFLYFISELSNKNIINNIEISIMDF